MVLERSSLSSLSNSQPKSTQKKKKWKAEFTIYFTLTMSSIFIPKAQNLEPAELIAAFDLIEGISLVFIKSASPSFGWVFTTENSEIGELLSRGSIRIRGKSIHILPYPTVVVDVDLESSITTGAISESVLLQENIALHALGTITQGGHAFLCSHAHYSKFLDVGMIRVRGKEYSFHVEGLEEFQAKLDELEIKIEECSDPVLQIVSSQVMEEDVAKDHSVDTDDVVSPSLLTVSVTPEKSRISFGGHDTFFVNVNLKASTGARGLGRPPLDLVCVLDMSGSMAGSKLSSVKDAMRYIYTQLGPNDRLSVVLFNSTSHVLHSLCNMTNENKARSERQVAAISANGGTSILAGLSSAESIFQSRGGSTSQSLSSVFLLTDGCDDNFGMGSAPQNLFHPHPPMPTAVAVPVAIPFSGFTPSFGCGQPPFGGFGFGAPAPAPAPSGGFGGFGAPAPAPAPSGGFGAPAPAPSGGFGASSSASSPAGFGSTPQPNMFGTTATRPNVFNARQTYPSSRSPKVEIAERMKLAGHSLFAFGFGSDHNSAELQAIADAAEGAFVFVERDAMVADAFGGALGGQRGIVARDIRLAVTMPDPTDAFGGFGGFPGSAGFGAVDMGSPVLLECLCGKYSYRIGNDGRSAEVSFANLFEGEERDVLLKVRIPACSGSGSGFGSGDVPLPVLSAIATYQSIEAPRCQRGHAMQATEHLAGAYRMSGWVCDKCGAAGTGKRWCCIDCSSDYCFSCVTQVTSSLNEEGAVAPSTCTLTRAARLTREEEAEFSLVVDAQRNRNAFTAALSRAMAAADARRLEEARSMLNAAVDEILSSPSHVAGVESAKVQVADLRAALAKLRSEADYSALGGRAVMSDCFGANTNQRCVAAFGGYNGFASGGAFQCTASSSGQASAAGAFGSAAQPPAGPQRGC